MLDMSRSTRAPFGPVIARSRRGVLHRAKPGPVLHARCAGGRAFDGDVLTAEQAIDWTKTHDGALCRYPWCFRSQVEAAGIDPHVGHAQRPVIRKRA